MDEKKQAAAHDWQINNPVARYQYKNIRRFNLSLNRSTEPEMVEWLESQDNFQGYIKHLIADDMKKQGK